MSEINLQGWYSMTTIFKPLTIREVNNEKVAECINLKKEKFYLTITPELDVRSSDNYGAAHNVTSTELIDKLEHIKSVYKVTFKKDDGEERSIRGYTVKPTDKFGRILIYDLDADSCKLVNNRELIELICNNTKYIIK